MAIQKHAYLLVTRFIGRNMEYFMVIHAHLLLFDILVCLIG